MTSRRLSLRVAVCLFAVTAVRSSHGNVRLPAIFSDHMVFQQQQPIAIWGWAEPTESINVTFGNQHASTQAAEDGTWKVSLPAMDASQSTGPYALVVSGNVTVTVRDILIGEIWVCSGQSNMA